MAAILLGANLFGFISANRVLNMTLEGQGNARQAMNSLLDGSGNAQDSVPLKSIMRLQQSRSVRRIH